MTGAWIKIKLHLEQEFVNGGYTEPEGSRKHSGALLEGFYEGKRLKFASRVGTGFSEKLLRFLFADLDVDELADPNGGVEEQLEHNLVLKVAAVLDDSEEPFQIGVGKQLRQPALFASPAQAQLLAGLLRIIEPKSMRSESKGSKKKP
jgi:ATP-dependent DNA ligase